MEIKTMNCTRKDLEKMSVLKRDKKNKKPKIWTYGDLFLKKDISDIVTRYKDEFEIFRDFDELDSCVFPEYSWTLDNKKYGYITKYYKEYNSLMHRIEKFNYSLEGKKNILFQIIELIKKLHEFGIVHGDLHGYNVIYDKFNIKLVDFDKVRFDHIESKNIYKRKQKEEINNLNLLILSVFFEKFLSNVSEEEYMTLIDELSISKEFKRYLVNSFKQKESQINDNLNIYINSVKNNDIFEGKKLVKSLKL